jgi:hypothetical protein
MSPRIIPIRLSGDLRKAQAKGVRYTNDAELVLGEIELAILERAPRELTGLGRACIRNNIDSCEERGLLASHAGAPIGPCSSQLQKQ